MRVLKAAVIKKLVALTLSTGDKIVSLIRLNKRWGADGLVRIQLCNVTSPRTMLSAEHGIWNTLSPFGKARHIRGLILLNFAELAEAVPIDAFSCLPIYQRYSSGRVWPRTANSYTQSVHVLVSLVEYGFISQGRKRKVSSQSIMNGM